MSYPIQDTLFVHNKSGKLYRVLFVAINANNSAPSGRSAVYQDLDGLFTFTRDAAEFAVKFREATQHDIPPNEDSRH